MKIRRYETETSVMRKAALLFLLTLLMGTLFTVIPGSLHADEGWPQRAGGDGIDRARATTIDANGNVYVAGSFQGTVTFGNPPSDDPADITVYEAKFKMTANGTDMFVGKLDAGGKWLWVVKGGGAGEDVANGIAVDKDGDVYVTGSFQPAASFGNFLVNPDPAITNQNTDVFVAKLSTSGNWVWINTAKGQQEQLGAAITVNEIKEVFITGAFRLNIKFLVNGSNYELKTLSYTGDTSSDDYDVFVAKLNSGGEWKWALSGGGTFPGISCLTGNWCCESPNSYYQHEHCGGLCNNYHHVCYAPWYDSNFGFDESQCRRYYGGTVQYYDGTVSNPTHPMYLLEMAGLYTPSLLTSLANANLDKAAQDLYPGRSGVCSLSASGNRVSNDRGVSIAVIKDKTDMTMPTNVIYVTGYFQGGVNTAGTYDFSISDNRSGQTGVPCTDCVTKQLAASGNGKKDLFVMKLVEVGTSTIGTPPPPRNPRLEWIVDAAGSGSMDEIWPNGLALDPELDLLGNPTALNLYVTGGYRGAPALGASLQDAGGETHAFVAKLFGSGSNSASWVWSRSAGPSVGAAEGFSVGADRVAVDARGVYLTGSFQNDLSFYGDLLPKTSLALTGYGSEKDVFVAKYGAGSGELQWATKGGLYQTDEPRGLATDASGSTVVVGTFSSSSSYLSKASTSLISGSAMSFNGVNEYVFGSTATSSSKYAISFWFRTDCKNCGVLSWSDGPLGTSDRDIWLNNGNLHARVYNEESIQTFGTDFADGRWHHVVHTFGGIGSGPVATIGQKIFVDGIERGRGSKTSSNFVFSSPGPSINIGYSARAANKYFSGMISNLTVLDTAIDNLLRDAVNPLTPFDLYADAGKQPNPASGGKILYTSGTSPLEDIFIASLGPTGKWRESETWTVGQVVPMPEGAAGMKPEFSYPADADNYFFWSEYEKKLYAVWPTGAVIKWRVSTDVTNFSRIITTGVSTWPEKPQTHIANIPVELQPGTTTYSYSALQRTETGATDSQRTSEGGAILNSSIPGYTVLRYANGGLDLTKYPVVFTVVKTVYWDNSLYLTDNAACTVGQRITDFSHNDPQGRNGYVFFNLSFYDGTGTSKAYDKATRSGPIIPVNEISKTATKNDHTTNADLGHDMVVVWYQTNTMNIPWPVKPVRYNCQWPAAPYKIIIASELGSDVLNQPPIDPLVYPEARVYRQIDKTKPGYNPNEEHASLFPSATGNGFNAVFALRNDLYNPLTDLPSKPYVLLKYRNPADGQWSMLVYQVLTTGYGYNSFNYQGTAGTPIFPPYPVRLLNGCPQSFGEGDPYWQDVVNNQYWSRSAGTVTAKYYYPLLLDYDYPNNPTTPDVFDGTAGQCVGWLDRRANGDSQPIGVSYTISWPADVPVLQVGETLLTAKRGLPDISSQASVQIVYDQLDPHITDPNNALVQLIDPLSPRDVLLQTSDGSLLDLPADIVTSNDNGKNIFDDLPFHLKVRLYFNPLTHMLSFKGYIDSSGMGDPLLLVNVMSASELDELLALSSDADFNAAVKALFNLTRNPQQLRLSANAQAEPSSIDLSDWETLTPEAKRARLATQPSLIGLQDYKYDAEKNKLKDNKGNYLWDGVPERLDAVGGGFALTAGGAAGTGFVTLVFNNDASLGSLPVSMQVIRVECAPSAYQGEIKVIQSDNVFDEKLTLRHSGDFGGAPERFQFEWYYQPDKDGLSPVPPPSPETFELNGWLPFAVTDPYGANDITIKGASLQTLSDNWYYVRYTGYPVCSNDTVPTPWAGAPGATPLAPSAQLAEGWIKRVVRALNPFEARVKDFGSSPTNTSLSMLMQLGERYEGNVAMNNDPDNLNSMGLISAYTTVLKRGIDLSIGGTPPINYEAANAALLLAGSRISDFYSLIGNEAYGDAVDPTIGFTTTSGSYGNEASSMFAFKNQLDSLLEEELVLLRGREYKAARPVFNRLVWNFTSGEGEVAYAQNYGIIDQNGDGIIDEKDARIMYPQGHGDAWGHYLTGIKGYYKLLRHPYYSWNPRPEAVLVSGAPVQVDYLDERKFARAAAAKAKVGAEIMNLTYRMKYVDNPEGQWQGYKDTDAARGWGLSEWGRRAGQGAYFDWVVANSILPAVDKNTAHSGIQKIDRTTVLELDDIAKQYYAVQSQIDMADAGLNPLGLAQDVVPFDIDPTQVSSGKTHFEQIYDRANVALSNALDVFNYANRSTQRLRENQKDIDDFANNAGDQEWDYQNRLIEIFGYPYSGDMGPTGTYPSDYDGPDIYHYMWVDQSELTGSSASSPGDRTVTLTFNPVFGVTSALPTDPTTQTVEYRYSEKGFGIVPTIPNPGVRRAQGEIQRAIAEFYREKANYEVAMLQYDNQLSDIQSKASDLEALSGYQTSKMTLLSSKYGTSVGFSAAIAAMDTTTIVLKRIGAFTGSTFKDVAHCTDMIVGFSISVGKPATCAIEMGADATQFVLETIADGIDIAKLWVEFAKDTADGAFDLAIEGVDMNFELNNVAGEIEALLRQEPILRLQAYTQKDVLLQALENVKEVLARGQTLLSERESVRALTAATTQQYRYQDMSFRIFRNDALQKYRAHFDLAAQYAYLAARAYDYETNLLKTNTGSGQKFLTDIIKQRSLGVIINDQPLAGSPGLSDPLARLKQNFGVLKGQLGFNNPQTETNRFSLRSELFRATDDATWRNWLNTYKVADLWAVPEFRRHCRPFTYESAGAQPGLVIPFSSSINFGKNFFGNPLGAGDSFYDPTNFTTKIRSVGVWFTNYNTTQLSNTPKVYLVPTGIDVMSSPSFDTLETRQWRVVDQKLPVPYNIGATDLTNPDWIPVIDSLSDQLGGIRRFSSFRAYHDSGVFNESETISDSRLIGRSVWNTQWKLIIPSGTFLYDPADPAAGINRFINGVSDIKLFFQTYGYSGN